MGITQEACTVNVSSFNLSKAITFSKIFSKVKLSPSARLVLRCLVDFWNPEKGLVYPGQKKIAEYTGMTRESVNKCINELRQENLILSSGAAGEKLKYYFTANFFKFVKTSQGSEKSLQGGSEKSSHHEQIIHEHDKKQNNFEIIILSNGFKIKTDFQKEYIDVFEKLSPEQIEKYKLLEGYEREKWLIVQRQEFKKANQAIKEIQEIEEIQETELPEFNDRKKGMEFCFNVYKLNPDYLFKEKTKAFKIAQHWGFNDEDYRRYKLYGEV